MCGDLVVVMTCMLYQNLSFYCYFVAIFQIKRHNNPKLPNFYDDYAKISRFLLLFLYMSSTLIFLRLFSRLFSEIVTVLFSVVASFGLSTARLALSLINLEYLCTLSLESDILHRNHFLGCRGGKSSWHFFGLLPMTLMPKSLMLVWFNFL
jgi:hypothetical protein